LIHSWSPTESAHASFELSPVPRRSDTLAYYTIHIGA
jgi:hypothetical protein